MKRILHLSLAAALLTTVAGCGTMQPLHSASMPLESFLVPVKDSVRAQGKKPLTLPASVLILALPDRSNAFEPIPETTLQQQTRLVREHLLKNTRYVKSVAIVAPEDIHDKTTLDRLADLYAADIVLILSYRQDQTRAESGVAAFLDITILPAILAPTVKVQTTTLINAKIIHVPSNAIIFLASGEDERTQQLTPYMAMEQGPGAAKVASFSNALERLDDDIDRKLDQFEHADLTHAVTLDSGLAEAGATSGAARWQQVNSYKQGGGGGSADIGLLLALAALTHWRARRQGRSEA